MSAMRPAGERKATDRRWTESLLVVSVWAVAIAVIRPVGNFPLHDDWDFATATYAFARDGQFQFTEFTVVSLRAMVLWGAAWVRLFGESFNVLRASTLSLSALTILVVHSLLGRSGVSRPLRLLATFSLLFHPIFLWASCTYMTEVPFVFVSLLALYAFHRGLGEDRLAWTAAASLLVVLSWFVRQTGVATAVAALIVILVARDRISPRWRSHAAIPLVSLVVFAALFIWKQEWLSGSPRMFAIHYQVWGESSFRLREQASFIYHYVVFNALNSAAFFFPLTLVVVGSFWRRLSRRELAALAAVTLLVFWRVGSLAAAGYLFPYSSDRLFSDILPGPVVFDLGIGPLNLYDTFVQNKGYLFTMAPVARVALTFAVAAGASLMMWALGRTALGWLRGGGDRSLMFALAGATVLVSTGALLGSGFYYDRYSLDSAWGLVLALPLVAAGVSQGWRRAGVVAMVVMALFSTFAVQEYFAWNRARWQAFGALRSRHVAVADIDGGTEAKAFYELAQQGRKAAMQPSPPRRFIIAFRPVSGYRVIERRPFAGFAGLRRGEVLTLERVTAGGSH